MQDKELIKRKNNLMKSILSNPKLAKTFRDAIKAPIGSTKRAQAKSVLSIMSKLKGIQQNDGQGGPTGGDTPNSSGTGPADYSNLMIFPAAPKFKKAPASVQISTKTPNNNGKGGPDFSFSTTPSTGFNLGGNPSDKTYSAPTPPTNPFAGLGKATYDAAGKYIGQPILDTASTISSLNPFAPKPNITFKGALSPYGTMAESTPVVAGNYGSPLNSNSVSTYPSLSSANISSNTSGNNTTGSTAGGGSPMGGDMSSSGSSPGGGSQDSSTSRNASDGTNTGSSGPSTQYPSLSSGDQILAGAKSAVAAGTGAGLFAMNVADQKFGGSLDDYINNLDQKLKTDFNLAPLEDQLNSIKSEKGNLIPTLQQYMTGKDQYLKFINDMITKQEGTLTSLNMADPFTAQKYTNQLNYLYTLQGRQNQRYGNFLNGAVADYNADVTNLQSNYDTVTKNYQDALTRGSTMAQDEYTNLYNSMTDLYNSLDQAPTKQANLEALKLANQANALTITQNSLTQSGQTNPKYIADVSTYLGYITDKNQTGTAQNDLDPTKFGANGLAGFFSEIAYQGGDPQAAAKAVTIAMAASISNSGGDVTKVNSFKKMVSDLAATGDTGAQYAAMISPTLAKSSSSTLSSYVLSNIKSMKSAATDLANNIAKKKTGAADKSWWLSKYKGLDSSILNDLYTLETNNITPGSAYEKNPSTFVSTLFQGGTDQAAADSMASNLISTWQ